MLKITILALFQGLAEFLPISSSGHLAFINHFFPKTPDDFFLAVFLHAGTLLAMVIYFWPDIVQLLTGFRLRSEKGTENRRYLAAIIVGTIPVAALGLFLEKWAENIFTSLPLLAVMFLITGLALAVASLKGEGKNRLKLPVALVIGCAQLLAVLPGISRSGSTISAGLISGLSRQEAFRFSFLLSLPAVAGALLIEGTKSLKAGIAISLPQAAIGFVLSFIFGLLALNLLRRLVLAGRLAWFSVYLLILGIFIAFL